MSILLDNDKFIILFGSVARNEHHKNSDVDILILNDLNETLIKNINQKELPKLPINYTHYDSYAFNIFFEKGSLFLHHLFTQGKVLYGNKHKWESLKKDFHVAQNFYDEQDNIISNLQIFKDTSIFNNHYLSPLTNLFPLLKNYCIFYLANRNIYEFDKQKSLKLLLPTKYQALLELHTYYDYSLKNISSNIPIPPSTKHAEILISHAVKFLHTLHKYP